MELIALVAGGLGWWWVARLWKKRGNGPAVQHGAGLLTFVVLAGLVLATPSEVDTASTADDKATNNEHPEQAEIAPADPLTELLRSATGDIPHAAYAVDATNYAHVEYVTQSMTVSSNLLKIKRAMPELLATYPEVNHFFFGFKQSDPYYMKVNIRRAAAERVNWQTVNVHDLPGYFEEYWLIPALR